MPELVLIDISNSRTKICAASADALVGEKRTVETATLSADDFGDFRDAERAILCSVVPDKTTIVRKVFGDRLHELTHESNLGIAVDYPEPSTIGEDRLANAAALAERGLTPGVVVDFGTAVTFDVVDARPAYIGGVIAPGLAAMTDYLYQETALLPRIDLEEPVEAIGKSTKDAMLAGAVTGYRGLVKEILHEVTGQLGIEAGALHVLATGGYAELLSAKIPGIEHVDPDLTLDGLRVIASRNP
ncbi:MAG: type III pantothenate kinase [Verrucomicrobiota bacterium]